MIKIQFFFQKKIFVSSEIIHRIKRNGKLTSKVLRSLLSETMEHLDLDGIYLTGWKFIQIQRKFYFNYLESGIKAVYTKCPNLKMLSLKGCGYVLNDHYCEQIIRVN